MQRQDEEMCMLVDSFKTHFLVHCVKKITQGLVDSIVLQVQDSCWRVWRSETSE